ncbi:uncharacterized protein LOC124275703 isoform X2 [Haliotis rubra]|uniref:uncharacterized protein LOC124275703 isoform X2 n=1 Tax=Haliotis rubra TaxID=36100 RepID=UPI001EE60C81|nr:uncharacterized protein LOC124275703 isoform X2 [Haliotis rubra]
MRVIVIFAAVLLIISLAKCTVLEGYDDEPPNLITREVMEGPPGNGEMEWERRKRSAGLDEDDLLEEEDEDPLADE